MKMKFTITSVNDAVDAVDMLMALVANYSEEPVKVLEPDVATAPATAPAPATATAPAPEEPVITEAQAGVELDVRNTPWIEAVHATTKTKNKDGTWKKKRGIDEVFLKETEAAARAKIAALPTEAATTVPTVPTVPTPDVPMAEPMQPTIAMEDVHRVWSDCMQNGLVTTEGALQMYNEIGVDATQLTVNETERRKLFDHLNGLLN